MNLPLANPTDASHARDRGNDARNVVSQMRHLVVSSHPAVVFTSLAALCVPALSDECRVIIEEQGRIGYRIIRPVPDPGSQLAALSEEYVSREGGSRQLLGARIVRTAIVATRLTGEPDYRGVVVHHWHTGRHPTKADAARAQRIVDRAVVTVHQERLARRLGQQQCAPDNPRQAPATIPDPEIDAAIAIVMACRRVPYAQALDLLRIASWQSHRKVRDLASDVVLTAQNEAARAGRIMHIRAQSPALRVILNGCDLEPRSSPSGRG